MRNLFSAAVVIFLASMFAAGCGGDECGTPDHHPDMAVDTLASCPGNVDVNPPNQVSCPSVGSQCRNQPTNVVCTCLCNHKWECDQVKLICDDDMIDHD